MPTSVADPRYLPAYSVTEASRYLRIPRTTLQMWVSGRRWPHPDALRVSKPLIRRPQNSVLLSFINLIEAHVLDAIRHEHQISFQKTRGAVDFVRKHLKADYPLADKKFETDGMHLFVQELGQLINVSSSGQLVVRELLEARLRRVERDEAGLAARLYPFTRGRARAGQTPKIVVIDPLIAFGRPVIAGTGIPTSVIAERYSAGESVTELASDYGRAPEEIEEAVRCELAKAA